MLSLLKRPKSTDPKRGWNGENTLFCQGQGTGRYCFTWPAGILCQTDVFIGVSSVLWLEIQFFLIWYHSVSVKVFSSSHHPEDGFLPLPKAVSTHHHTSTRVLNDLLQRWSAGTLAALHLWYSYWWLKAPCFFSVPSLPKVTDKREYRLTMMCHSSPPLSLCRTSGLCCSAFGVFIS